MRRQFFLVLLLLVTMSFAIADYNFYTTYGNSNGIQRNVLGTGTTTGYVGNSPSTGNSGSVTEPIVYDLNGDGINELFVESTNGVLAMYEGSDLDGVNDLLQIGQQEISPVICDVNNDGVKDYVTITDFNGTKQLLAIDYSTSGMILVNNKTTNATNIYGNLACDKFFTKQGDTNNYVLWVDNEKYLHYAKGNGASFTETILNPESSATKESTGYTYSFGSHQIVVDDNFDSLGEHSAIFQAGNFTVVYNSDGTSESLYTNNHTGTGAPTALKWVGKIHRGGTRNVAAFYTSGGQNGEHFDIIQQETSIFTGRSLTKTVSKTIGAPASTDGFPGCSNGPYDASGFITNFNGDTIDDLGFVVRAQPNFPCLNPPQQIIIIFNPSNGTKIGGTFYSGAFVATDPNPNDRAYSARMTGGSLPDILWHDGVKVWVSTQADNYSTRINIINYTSATSFNYPPVPVDVRRTGTFDLILTTPALTKFFRSSSVTPQAVSLPFSVNLNTTQNVALTSTQHIKFLGAASTNPSYTYSVICDNSAIPLFYETFNSFYNLSSRNLTSRGTAYNNFTVNGLEITTPFPPPGITFDFLESIPQARSAVQAQLSYQSITNTSLLDLVFYDDIGRTTQYYRLVYSATKVIVYDLHESDYFFPHNIGNVTTGQNLSVNVYFSPRAQPIIDDTRVYGHMDAYLVINNIPVTTATPTSGAGSNIKTVEFSGGLANNSYVFNTFATFASNNPAPPFVTFTNGVITRIDQASIPANVYNSNNGQYANIVFTSNDYSVQSPPVDAISGQGFTALPYYNQDFYSTCYYTTSGTYTQRHFLTEATNEQYTNYHDFTVTITNITTSTTTTQDSETTGTGSGDIGTDIIPSFLTTLGLKSSASMAMAWLVIILVIAILVGLENPFIGLLAFVVGLVIGAILGLVPIWVTFILVVITAGISVMTIRRVIAGA